MKKIVLYIVAISASLLFFASCNKEHNTIPEESPESRTYTLTISATKSIETKQYVLDETGAKDILDAVWGAGDVVKVYARNNQIGTLSPLSTGGADAILSGSVTIPGDFVVNSEYIDLMLGGDLSSQDGSLENLPDWSKAWFQVSSIDYENNVIVPGSAVTFSNWTSIVRFNVMKGSTPLEITNMEIRVKTGDPNGFVNHKLSITPTSSTDMVYVALANYNEDTPVEDDYEVLVTSKDDDFVYSCIAKEKTFLRGGFYDVNLKVSRPVYTVVGEPVTTVFSGENSWQVNATGNELTYDSETGLYTHDFPVSGNATVKFKVVRNYSWDSGSWPNDDYQYIFPSDGTLSISFNPSTWTVDATGVIDKSYTVAGSPASIFGTEWDSKNTNNDMTLKSDGSLYKVFSNVASGTEIKFKVCESHAWTTSYGYRDGKTNCGNNDGNCVWTATENCDIWIYINPGNDNYIFLQQVVD